MPKSQTAIALEKMKAFLPSADLKEQRKLLNQLVERATSVRVLNLCLDAHFDASGSAPDINRLHNLIDGTVRQIMLRKIPPVKEQPHSNYHKLWRIVDGAVADAFFHHPDYLTPKGKRNARESIVKRVTGAVLGFAEETAKGRSDFGSAADK